MTDICRKHSLAHLAFLRAEAQISRHSVPVCIGFLRHVFEYDLYKERFVVGKTAGWSLVCRLRRSWCLCLCEACFLLGDRSVSSKSVDWALFVSFFARSPLFLCFFFHLLMLLPLLFSRFSHLRLLMQIRSFEVKVV